MHNRDRYWTVRSSHVDSSWRALPSFILNSSQILRAATTLLMGLRLCSAVWNASQPHIVPCRGPFSNLGRYILSVRRIRSLSSHQRLAVCSRRRRLHAKYISWRCLRLRPPTLCLINIEAVFRLKKYSYYPHPGQKVMIYIIVFRQNIANTTSMMEPFSIGCGPARHHRLRL